MLASARRPLNVDLARTFGELRFRTEGAVNAAVEFAILGPLEARRGGDELIPLGRPKQRAVLAVLVLHANQVVSLDRLLALLWSTGSSRSIGAAQVYVSNLRRALEPDRPPRTPARILISQAGGYRLAVDPAAVDAVRFETETAAGIRLLAQERPEAARDTLTGALALWRGSALADFAFEEFAQLEAERLEKLRLVAVEARLDAELALGEHVSAVPRLEQLVAEHPLRERLWAMLMLALYRSGRQADALRTYQRCRASLAAELGIDPGPELRRLEATVLAQDPLLEWRPPAAIAPVLHRLRRAPPAAAPKEAAPGALVGRSEQMARLQAAWARACDTQAGFILVSGEAGIGKTRLAQELAGVATGEGARAVWGRCYEADEAPAFWPWSQILAELLADLAPSTVDRALDDVGLGLVDMAPVVPLRGPHREDYVVAVGAGDARFRLYRAVAVVVRAAAAERPLALFLDDLHWADTPSLELLRFLATELGDGPVAVVLTYRQAEPGERQRLLETLGALARQAVIERVVLTGLGPNHVGEFIAVVTGADVAPALATAVHRRTEGNPFFMTEVVRLLESEGSLSDDARAATEHSQVPVGVRDVTRRRLSHLPDSTQRLLELAAVAGREFDLEVITAASTMDDETALDHFEPALVSGMVLEMAEPLRWYRFSHALVRDALYDELSSTRRARLHARVAGALEARCGPDGAAVELARHFFLARQVVGAEKCIPYLLRAAEAAMLRLAHERAEQHLHRALDLLASMPADEERDRRELWVQTRLGLVVGTTAGPAAPEVAKVFARARALCASTGNPAVELPMIYGPFLFAWAGADQAAAHGYADQLLDLAARSEDPRYLLGGHLAKGLILFDQGTLAAAGGHFERVTVLADSLADPWLANVLHADPRVTGRLLRAHVLTFTGRGDQSEALTHEGLELARQFDHAYTGAVALTMTAFTAVVGNRPGAAQELAEAGIEYATTRSFPHLVSGATGMLGWAIASRGDPATGLGLVRRHMAEASNFSRVRHFHLALTAEVELWAGLLDDALATVAQALAEAEATGSRFYVAELHRIRGATLVASSPALADEAEGAYTLAVEVARGQGAFVLAERAEAGLESCRQQHPSPTRRLRPQGMPVGPSGT